MRRRQIGQRDAPRQRPRAAGASSRTTPVSADSIERPCAIRGVPGVARLAALDQEDGRALADAQLRQERARPRVEVVAELPLHEADDAAARRGREERQRPVQEDRRPPRPTRRSARPASVWRIAFCRPWTGTAGSFSGSLRGSNRSGGPPRPRRGRPAASGPRPRRARGRAARGRRAPCRPPRRRRRRTTRAGRRSALAFPDQHPVLDPPHAVHERDPRACRRVLRPNGLPGGALDLEVDRGRLGVFAQLDRALVFGGPGVEPHRGSSRRHGARSVPRGPAGTGPILEGPQARKYYAFRGWKRG